MEPLTKEEISKLPLFDGLPSKSTHIVKDSSQAKIAIQHMSQYGVIGFDTESKPCFVKGEKSTGPHLIQISTLKAVFLFPTEVNEAVRYLFTILENSDIKKVGFGLKGDKVLLFQKFGVHLCGSIDLASLIQEKFELKKPIGARGGIAMLLGKRLSKAVQISNWAQRPITPKQIKYASNDAYSAILTYMRVMEITANEIKIN